jgi:dGTPase
LTRIEKHRNQNGLNLSGEVLDGVLYHSGYGKGKPQASTLEGQVIHLSDKIAYVQHDIDDSIRAGLLKLEDIPSEYLETLGYTHSQRIATLVTDVIANTSRFMDKADGDIFVSFCPEIDKALQGLRHFMFEFIYQGRVCQAERRRATFIIEHLFDYFLKHPQKMTEFYREIAEQEGMETAVADYISGMSDAFCIALFEDIYIPQSLVPNALKSKVGDEY